MVWEEIKVKYHQRERSPQGQTQYSTGERSHRAIKAEMKDQLLKQHGQQNTHCSFAQGRTLDRRAVLWNFSSNGFNYGRKAIKKANTFTWKPLSCEEEPIAQGSTQHSKGCFVQLRLLLAGLHGSSSLEFPAKGQASINNTANKHQTQQTTATLEQDVWKSRLVFGTKPNPTFCGSFPSPQLPEYTVKWWTLSFCPSPLNKLDQHCSNCRSKPCRAIKAVSLYKQHSL